MRVKVNGKIWDKDSIQELIDSNADACARALMIVYGNQTASEQSTHQTIERNGKGFTGRDAEFLTDVAQKYHRYGRWASTRQFRAVARCVRKYHRQVLEHMAAQGGEIVKGRQTKQSAQTQMQEVVEQGFGAY